MQTGPRYYLRRARYELRSALQGHPINTYKYSVFSLARLAFYESLNIISTLRGNPLAQATLVLSIGAALLLPLYFFDQIGNLAESVMYVSVGLTTLFITAAVFIATMSRRDLENQINSEKELSKAILGTSEDLAQHADTIVNYLKDPHDIYLFLKGYAAAIVFDQKSYGQFHSLVIKNRQRLRDLNSYGIEDSIASLSHSSILTRYYSIEGLFYLIDEQAPQYSKVLDSLRMAFRGLSEATHLTSHMQGSLLGPQLTRVIAYNLFAILATVIFGSLGFLGEGIFSIEKYIFLSLVVALHSISVYLSLGYMFQLLHYFRLAEGRHLTHTDYFYREDDSLYQDN